MFEVKEFELLHVNKIKYPEEVPVHSKYFFCIDDMMLFIKKSRGYYKLMASTQCGLNFLYRESTFDVVSQNKDLSELLKDFSFYMELVRCRAFHLSHSE